jgi:pimeloyl-ACP methyl ester carboxylesterase
MRWYKKSLLILTACLVTGYLGVIGYFVHEEHSLVYDPTTQLRAIDPEFANKTVAVRFPADDGTSLSARIIWSPVKTSRWILFFHSNGGNITTHQLWWHVLSTCGANVLALDYRGYGESAGIPSESGLYMDAAAGYRYLRDVLGVTPSNIVLYGFSLGGAVAIDLASKIKCAALILEGVPLSIAAVGQEEYPFLPVTLIVRDKFDSEKKIALVKCPKLFLQARNDPTVPFHQAMVLYNLADQSKQLILVSGNRHSAIRDDQQTTSEAIRHFLDDVAKPDSVQSPDR